MVETLYRHKKRGTTYRILHSSTFQTSYFKTDKEGNDLNLDGIDVIVYQDLSNPYLVWVRPTDEFFDGRFEKVS